MASLLSLFARIVKDPPPELVFEIAPDAVRMARTGTSNIQTASLPPGVISPSPLHENVILAEPLNEAVAQLAPASTRKKRRTAAVLLPDYSAHLAVVDFTGFPDSREEQAGLIRARMRRTVPFDIEGAALSFSALNGAPAAASNGKAARREVVVAITPPEIIQRYEAPFRRAGMHPGLVTLAPLASLALVENRAVCVIARLSGHVLTVLVLKERLLKLVRSIELADNSAPLDEIARHLFQTFVYVEDNLGQPAEQLLLAGFGPHEAAALAAFPAEFSVSVRVLGGSDTGIRGYLKGAAA